MLKNTFQVGLERCVPWEGAMRVVVQGVLWFSVLPFQTAVAFSTEQPLGALSTDHPESEATCG